MGNTPSEFWTRPSSMFHLTHEPIDSAALQARIAAPEAGALTIFEGRVRNHHLGQPVTLLEYEAFDEMAQREGEAIVAETEQLYPGVRVECVHRTGALAIGEAAIWIGVASPHRQQGFAACRHVIEEVKLRLPVWKKEHRPGGAAEWVNCSAEAIAANSSDELHARQIALPEVGAPGQARLAAARIAIIGVGGLGCPAALYLAGAGIGTLTLVDSGKVERSNLHRQILFTTAEIGSSKVLAAAARLRLHNPAGRIQARPVDLNPGNARTLVAGHDVVLDCTDNFATRFAVHDACLSLGIPLVQAAIHQFEGTLDVFAHRQGGCLHCLWLGRGAADLDIVGSCDGAPVFGPAVGVIGVMQAAEAIKLLLGLDAAAAHQTRLVNLIDGTQLSIERPVRSDCPVCSSIENLRASTVHSGSTGDSDLFVTASNPPPGATRVRLVEPSDDSASVNGTLTVAAGDLSRLRELAASGPLVLSCRHGLRSTALARLLRTEGIPHVYALLSPEM